MAIQFPSKSQLLKYSLELSNSKFTPGIDNISASQNLEFIYIYIDQNNNYVIINI